MKYGSNQFGDFFEDQHQFIFFSNKKSYEFLNSFNKEVIFAKQVHKTHIHKIPKNHKTLSFSSSLILEADGLKTDKRNLALAIQTADCVPCFLSSKEKMFSLHLGWRSLVNGLLDKALLDFSKKEELNIFIGPHISFDSFEVGKEVVKDFKDKHDFRDWYKEESQSHYISLIKVIKQKCSSYNIKLFKADSDTLLSKDHFSYRRAVKGNLNPFPYRNISLAYLK